MKKYKLIMKRGTLQKTLSTNDFSRALRLVKEYRFSGYSVVIHTWSSITHQYVVL